MNYYKHYIKEHLSEDEAKVFAQEIRKRLEVMKIKPFVTTVDTKKFWGDGHYHVLEQAVHVMCVYCERDEVGVIDGLAELFEAKAS